MANGRALGGFLALCRKKKRAPINRNNTRTRCKLFHSFFDRLVQLPGKPGLLRVPGALHSAPEGEMAPHIATRLPDIHSVREPFPVVAGQILGRDEMTSESVFKVLRIIKIVIKVDLVKRPHLLRSASVVFSRSVKGKGLVTSVEVPAIMPRVHKARFILTNLPRFSDCVNAFPDDQFVDNFRNRAA